MAGYDRIDDGSTYTPEQEQINLSAAGTHIIECPADTDIIGIDPNDLTKIITIAPFKLRTIITNNGISSVKSIILIPVGTDVANTIPAFSGGWLGVRDVDGGYEFFSKDKRDDFYLATECPIGRADRTETDISAIVSLPELGFGYGQDLYNLIAATGSSKHLSGGDLQAIPGGLTLKRLEGRWWRTFANRDENQRHKMTNTEHNPIASYEIHSASGNVDIPTQMEVGFIDNGTGGKIAINDNEWSFYLCYHWPRHTGVGYEGFQRSTRSFGSLHDAKSSMGQGIPEMHPALDAAVLTHIIYIKGNATDLNNPEQCDVQWVRKDNIGSSGDPLVGGLQQSGVIDWVGDELLTINADASKFDRAQFRIGSVNRATGLVKFVRTVAAQIEIPVTNLTTEPYTYYGYNIGTDSFVQQPTPMARPDLDNIIPIGRLWHRDKAKIDDAQTMPLVIETSHDYAGQLLAFGALKQSGLNLSANGANKKVNLSTGVLEVLGGTSTSRENISNAQPANKTPLTFTPVHRAITTHKVVFEPFSENPDYDKYDNGSGTLAILAQNNFGIHYFYIFAFRDTVDVFLIRGDESYATLIDAQTGLQQNPIPIPSDFKSGFPLSAVIAKRGTADLETAIADGDAVISSANRFGSFGAGGGGGIGGDNVEAGTDTGQMTYWDNVSGQWKAIAVDALSWDNINKRLGIGTASPATNAHLHEPSGGQAYIFFTNTGSTAGKGIEFGLFSNKSGGIWNRENAPVRFATNNVEGASLGADGNWKADNYTKSGSDAPAIKHKLLTGTTASAEGGTESVTHGLTGSKIISWCSKVKHIENEGIGHHNTSSEGYHFDDWHTDEEFKIHNVPLESYGILTKSFTIFVTYQE